MKKNLAFLLLVCAHAAIAQTTEEKNMVKINLSAFAFKGFNFQYERQVSARVTVALGYGAIPFSSLPYKSYIKKQIFIPDADIANFRLSTSIFTPEVRYYFGKRGAFHGFYIAPYGRFGSYKISGPIVYDNSDNIAQKAEFTGKLHASSAGIMVGSSWQISPKFYIDWWIAGAGYGRESGDFTALTQLSASDQSSLRKTLNSITLSGITLSSQVNDGGAFIHTWGNIVGARAMGINIGFRF